MKNVTLITSSVVGYYDLSQGGWAYVLRCGSDSVEGSGRTKNAFRLRPRFFSERLELLAVIKGLERLKAPCEVLHISKSEDLLRAVSSSRFDWREQGWPKLNYLADLGQRLDEAAEKHIIDTQQIKEESGDPDKKRCDQLALSQLPSEAISV